MTYDVISYILIGSLFASLAVPVIALMVKSFNEQKHLNEDKAAKKLRATRQKTEDIYSYIN